MSGWIVVAFVVGVFVGGNLGLVVAALLLANDGAERMEGP